MALLYNLARMTVSSTGTGTITLNAAAQVDGVQYLSFTAAGVTNGQTVAYAIADIGQSEIGTGVYNAGTLTRNVTNSTNGGSAIDMTAAAQVFITPRTEDIANKGETNTFTALQTFSANLISPSIIGGTAAGSDLTFQTTTGNGSGDEFIWRRGNNGATVAAILNATGLVVGPTASTSFTIEAFGAAPFIMARPAAATGSGEVGASDTAYSSNFRATTLRQYSSSASGTSLGLSNASLGLIQFQNTSNALIYTNGATALSLGTNGAVRMSMGATGDVIIGTTTVGRLGVGNTPNAKVRISNASAGVTALQLEGVAANFFIDFSGGGSNSVDGTTTNFRSFSTGTAGMIYTHPVGAVLSAGGLNIAHTTASTLTTNGALVVAGGAGVGGAFNLGGIFFPGTGTFAGVNIAQMYRDQAGVLGLVISPSTGSQSDFYIGNRNGSEVFAVLSGTSNLRFNQAGGTSTFGGGGTGATTAVNILNGGSAATGGAYTAYRKNGASQWAIGHASAIAGGTSDDFLWFGPSGLVLRLTVIGSNLQVAGGVEAYTGTAIPAGGTTGYGIKVSSTTNFGVFFGSGAPTLIAAQGSLYMRSDGSTTTNRMYVNVNSSAGWTAVTTSS